MVEVIVRNGENIEDALRRFKRQCERDGLLQEIKRREFYKAPNVIRKEKNAEFKRRSKYKKRMEQIRGAR